MRAGIVGLGRACTGTLQVLGMLGQKLPRNAETSRILGLL